MFFLATISLDDDGWNARTITLELLQTLPTSGLLFSFWHYLKPTEKFKMRFKIFLT